jgi:hypothetical protein
MRVTTPLLTRSAKHAREQPVALEVVAFTFRLIVNYNSNKFQICLSAKFKVKFVTCKISFKELECSKGESNLAHS